MCGTTDSELKIMAKILEPDFQDWILTSKCGSCKWKLEVFLSEGQISFIFHADIEILTSFTCLYKCGCLYLLYTYVYSLSRTSFGSLFVCSVLCIEMAVFCLIKWLYLDIFSPFFTFVLLVGLICLGGFVCLVFGLCFVHFLFCFESGFIFSLSSLMWTWLKRSAVRILAALQLASSKTNWKPLLEYVS